MRIISGKYKGLGIRGKVPSNIRPTTDKNRESLFNILNNIMYFEDKVVLDLHCGSGMVGAEFLSRGARHCTFVDISGKSVSVCQRNLKEIKIPEDDYLVLKLDSISYLKNSEENTFDIIFSDAPYKKENSSEVAEIIAKNDLLTDIGFLILESSGKEDIDYNTDYYNLVSEKNLGDIKITILEKN